MPETFPPSTTTTLPTTTTTAGPSAAVFEALQSYFNAGCPALNATPEPASCDPTTLTSGNAPYLLPDSSGTWVLWISSESAPTANGPQSQSIFGVAHYTDGSWQVVLGPEVGDPKGGCGYWPGVPASVISDFDSTECPQ